MTQVNWTLFIILTRCMQLQGRVSPKYFWHWLRCVLYFWQTFLVFFIKDNEDIKISFKNIKRFNIKIMICCMRAICQNFHSETNLKLHVAYTGEYKDKMFDEWPLQCRIVNRWFILILWTPGLSRKYLQWSTPIRRRWFECFLGNTGTYVSEKILGSRVSQDTLTNITNFIVAT